MDVERQLCGLEGNYVDWKNRPVLRGYHGGIFAASIVLVVEILENLAYLANASNLVLYLSKYIHVSPSNSANMVTTFMGTTFLLAVLGGFLSDAFLTTYYIFLLSALTEFLGLLILTMQAHQPSLRPPVCLTTDGNITCHNEATVRQKAILFTGLYLVALGAGGIKGSLPPHGAEQFDENMALGRKHRSTFFNYYVFCLSCGALIAVTFVVWIEDNIGWEWGVGVSTLSILISAIVFLLGSPKYRIKVPKGSPITAIIKVFLGAISLKFCSRNPSTNAVTKTSLVEENLPKDQHEGTTDYRNQDLGFLDGATITNKHHQGLDCSKKQVEDVKIIVKTIPIFTSTIMLNCCLAQLSTFSIQQASTMNTNLGPLKVPPASLPVFPVIFTMILILMYNQIILPLARKLTKTEMGITHLQRIGTGLVLSIMAMAVAALVETKRKRVALQDGLENSNEPIPITFFWIALQYLFLGSADTFSLAGLMDFFFTEAPKNMRSLATSLSWASLAMGYYLSSVLVSIVNRVTGGHDNKPWLRGSNLNHYHLERFYWLMCILSGLNFLHYLYWACRYQYRSMASSN